MAKIIDYAVTIYTAVTTNMVMEMPEHQTGDLLVACLNKDTNTAFTTPAGWYAAKTQNHTGGAAAGIYTKRAASSSETVTFTLTSETCIGVLMSIRGAYGIGADGSDAVDAGFVTGADDSSFPFAGAAVTTRFNNELIIHMLSGDAVYGTFPLPGVVMVWGGDTGANSIAVGYDFKKIKGAAFTPSFWSGTAADDTRGLSIAIIDDGTGDYIPPYVNNTTNSSTVPATLISPLINHVTAPNKGTFKTAAPLDIATVGAKTLTYITVTTNSADVGYNPFHGVVRINSTSSTTVLYGNELTLSSAENMTLGLGVIFGMWQFTAPRDYLDVGKAVTGGVLLGIADAENDYKFWTIGAQLAKTTTPWNMMNYAIQVQGTSDTSYASSGTLGYSAINDIYFAAQGYFGATQVDRSQLWLLYGTSIYGGSDANPLDFLDIENAVNNGASNIPLFQRTGSSATVWTPLKFGGVDSTHINVNLRTFQYPRKADEVDYLDFHVDNNYMGYEFHGLNNIAASGGPDEIKFTNCVFTSDSPYYWRFNASHTSAAELDFSGSTIVNATVTLRPSVTLVNASFIDCPSFVQNNATLNSCTIDNTTIESTNLGRITNCEFQSDSVSGAYGIIMNTPGVYNFDGNSFTGFATTSGSTGLEAILNNTGGHLTINVLNASTPSIRNSVGGSWTTINNYKTLTLTGIVENSEVRILLAGTQTELAGAEDVDTGTFEYSYNYIAGTYIDIVVHNLQYQYYRISNYELGSSNASLPINQVIDRNYSNP